MAYVQYADGQSHPPLSGLGLIPVEGPPGIGQQSSDAYTINAKAEGAPSNAMMGGPMLQSILDVFKLVGTDFENEWPTNPVQNIR